MPCPYFRGSQFDAPLRALGIEPRYVSGIAGDGETFDTEPLEWADVVVFRRFYDTLREVQSVVRAGYRPFSATRWAWDWAVGRKPILYDTDDDPLTMGRWNSQYPIAQREADFIREMARKATLVTVATPALAARYGSYNRRVVVIRNAVDPAIYRPTTEKPDRPLTALFYASAESRLRDYFGEVVDGKHRGGQAAAAVRAARLRTVFFGYEGGPDAPKYFDEVIRYVRDIPTFARTLANVHADVGLAPLVGDDFDRAKSELHWLEYTCAGVPTVAQRLMRPAPYDVIRDGTDGLVAKNTDEWTRAVRRLVESPALRADLVAAARERVAGEYDYRIRVAEWADAYRAAME